MSLQKLSQLECVGRCGVIEIHVDVVALLLPATDSRAPVGERGRSIVSLVAANGAVALDDSRGRYVVMIRRQSEMF